MTDSRITRIVDQLADLTDDEMVNLLNAINTKREERRRERQEEAIRQFEKSFQELVKLNVDVIYDFNNEDGETILNLEDISFQPW